MSQFGSGVLQDVLNGTTVEFQKGFNETLGKTDYGFAKWALERAKGVGGLGSQHNIRVGLVSSLTTHAPFKPHSIDPILNVIVQYTVPPRWLTMNESYDELEKDLQGSKEQVYDAVEARQSAAIEKKFESMEDYVLGMPNDSTDNETPHGLWYHLRMYTNSSGVPQAVSDGIPDYLGIYHDGWGDGTTTSLGTYFGVDRTTAANSRLNNLAVDYSGSIDDDFRVKFRWMRKKLKFETLPGLKGAQDYNSPYIFAVSQSIAVQMETEGNAGPDDTNGDSGGRYTKALFQGITPLEFTKLDDDEFSRLALIRQSKLYPIALNGSQTRSTLVRSKDCFTTWNRHTLISFNLDCDNPRDAGGVFYVV